MKKTGNDQTFSGFLTELEQRKRDDYEWGLNDRGLQRRYAGMIVVVYRRKVLGAGKTYQTAWAAAQRHRDCPEKREVAMPVVPHPTHERSAEN